MANKAVVTNQPVYPRKIHNGSGINIACRLIDELIGEWFNSFLMVHMDFIGIMHWFEEKNWCLMLSFILLVFGLTDGNCFNTRKFFRLNSGMRHIFNN